MSSLVGGIIPPCCCTSTLGDLVTGSDIDVAGSLVCAGSSSCVCGWLVIRLGLMGHGVLDYAISVYPAVCMFCNAGGLLSDHTCCGAGRIRGTKYVSYGCAGPSKALNCLACC